MAKTKADGHEPRTKNQEQRTKRKYTVSDKVRAANRINSAKARSVDKEIRYRRTPKRLAANRASLVKALYVRDQLRAADLRKSAVRAGESQEEYDRHLELVEQALPAEGERQRNGVRGLAQALWRRRRLFVSRVQRETFSFYLELEKAAGAGLCLDSVQSLEYASRSVFLEGEHPRLEEAVERLDKRLVQVAEAYLTEVRQALVHLGVFGKHPYRAGLLDQPPEVIGNGLVGPREVMRRMQGGRPSGRFISFLAWLRHDCPGPGARASSPPFGIRVSGLGFRGSSILNFESPILDSEPASDSWLLISAFLFLRSAFRLSAFAFLRASRNFAHST